MMLVFSIWFKSFKNCCGKRRGTPLWFFVRLTQLCFLASRKWWLTKLVGWDFVFSCWSCYSCCCYCYVLLKGWANGCCEYLCSEELSSSFLHCFCFCRLFVNASFLKLKNWRHAGANVKFGVLSMKWFTSVSVLTDLPHLSCISSLLFALYGKSSTQ